MKNEVIIFFDLVFINIDLFNYYLQQVDPNKEFFTQGNIQELEKYKFSLDDQIKYGSLDFHIRVNECDWIQE